jgi:hypothetical protein
MKRRGNYMAAAEMSMIYGSAQTALAASVPRLTFPPPPKPSLLGFHRAHLSLRGVQIQAQVFGFLLAEFTLHRWRSPFQPDKYAAVLPWIPCVRLIAAENHQLLTPDLFDAKNLRAAFFNRQYVSQKS